MAKAAVGQWTRKDKEFANALKGGLVAREKGYKDLMRLTQKSQSTIHARYRQPETITVGELRVFIRVAGLSKEDVLNLLFKDE